MSLLSELKKRLTSAGKDTGQFAKTIFAAPAQSVANTVRTAPVLIGGALLTAANAAKGKGSLDKASYEAAQQQVNKAVPRASFGEQALDAYAKRFVPQVDSQKFAKVGQGATDIATQFAVGKALPITQGIDKVKALEKVSAIPKLLGYTGIRAGEGYISGAAGELADSGNVSKANEVGRNTAILSGVANVALSPKLTAKAAKEAAQGVRKGAVDIANSDHIREAVSTFRADVPLYTDVVEKGTKIRRPVSQKTVSLPESIAQEVLQKNASKDFRDAQIVNDYRPNEPRVTFTFDDNTGKLLSWEPDNAGFAEQFTKSVAAPQSGKVSTDLLTGGLTGKAIKKQGDVGQYIQSKVQDQKLSTKPTLPSKLLSAKGEIKKKFQDFTAPIEDTLTKAEKDSQLSVLPKQDVRYQIDRVLRANEISGQLMKDTGFAKAVQNVDNLDEFNQYLIAKQAGDVAATGKATGRNLEMDKKLVGELGPKYEEAAQAVYGHNQAVLQQAVDAGLVSKETQGVLLKQYKNYVPLQRVMEAVDGTPQGNGKAVASLSGQSVVKKLKGSEREIQNPLESIVVNTESAVKQIEKNRSAQMLAGYESLPGNPFQLKRLEPGEHVNSNSTFSVFENGKKITYQTTPEIASAAKALDIPQMGLLEKVVRYGTRSLQLGATALNAPFAATNYLKDQTTSFINQPKSARQLAELPLNFLKGISEAVGQGKFYEEWVRAGGGGSSFSAAQGDLPNTVAALRASKNLGSKIQYVAKNPAELLKAVEDVIGTTEKATRVQNFKSTYDELIRQGRTETDAKIMAAAASRDATANFARRGEWGRALNATIPFFNAGIQGAKSLRNGFKKDPVGFTGRFIATIGIPMAAAVTYNLSDPDRKAAYDDIQDYEKENNLIFILDPKPGENGKYKAVKIPLPPGYSNLANIARRGVEDMFGYDNQSLLKIAGDLTAATTSVNPSDPRGLLNQVTPQILKTPVEVATNTNLFTGNQIVPQNLKDLPPEFQAKSTTSETARRAGELTGTSPLQIDNAIKTNLGGLGSQIVNASDRLLGAAKPGGESAVANLERRFSQAAGGVNENKAYEEEAKRKAIRALEKQADTGVISQERASKGIVRLGGTPAIQDTQAPEQSNSPVKQSQSDDKFYFYNKDNQRKSYKTKEQADLAYAKYQVSEGDQSDVTVGNTRVVADPSVASGYKVYDLGKIKKKTEEQLRDAKAIKAKQSGDYKAWEQVQREKFADYEKDKQNLDPELETPAILALEKKQDAILQQVKKYRSQGGSFTAPKKVKVKAAKKPPKVALGTASGKVRKVRLGRSATKPKSSIKITKVKPASVSIKKLKVSNGKRA